MTKKNPRQRLSLRGAESLLGPLSAPLKVGVALGRTMKQKNSTASQKKKSSGRRRKNNESNQVMPAAHGVAAYSSLRNATPSKISTGRCIEFVDDLIASTTAGNIKTTRYPLNPGNNSLFPRLNAMADLYQQWRFKHFRAIYRPVTAVTNSGVVGMCVDYDSSASPPSSVASLMSNATSVIGPIYEPIVLDLDCRHEKWYYTHNGNTSSGGALARQQDPGSLFFVSDKCVALQPLGFLSIDYEIEFLEPKPPSTVASGGTFPSISNTLTGAPGTGSTFRLYPAMLPSFNHGFVRTHHINGADDVVTLPTHDYVTAQAGTFLLRSRTIVTMTAGAPASACWAFQNPGSDWNVVNVTNFSGTGSAQTVDCVKTIALDAGARIHLVFIIAVSPSTPVTIAIDGAGSSFQLVSFDVADYGDEKSYGDEVKQSASSFVLPLQLSQAIDFLNGLSGSVLIEGLDVRFKGPNLRFDEEDDYHHLRQPFRLGTPRSVKSSR